jgi:hypothetical protein
VSLSICIPWSGNDQAVEDTLVSVLENRPENAQILVVHYGQYDDPYDLAGEVEFVESTDPQLANQLNTGLTHATGEIFHPLVPGATVRHGWTNEPVAWLNADPDLASVSPLVVEAENSDRVVTAGVAYSAGGGRRELVSGRAIGSKQVNKTRPLGPSWRAGFFRSEDVLDLGGWDATVGSQADVDLSLALRADELDCELSTKSVIHFSARPLADAGFRAGRDRQRLFLRHRGAGARALFAHPIAVAVEFAVSLPNWTAWTGLMGRCAGLLEVSRQRSHQRQPLQSAIGGGGPSDAAHERRVA